MSCELRSVEDLLTEELKRVYPDQQFTVERQFRIGRRACYLITVKGEGSEDFKQGLCDEIAERWDYTSALNIEVGYA